MTRQGSMEPHRADFTHWSVILESEWVRLLGVADLHVVLFIMWRYQLFLFSMRVHKIHVSFEAVHPCGVLNQLILRKSAWGRYLAATGRGLLGQSRIVWGEKKRSTQCQVWMGESVGLHLRKHEVWHIVSRQLYSDPSYVSFKITVQNIPVEFIR